MDMLVIARITLLICYKIIMEAHAFFAIFVYTIENV